MCVPCNITKSGTREMSSRDQRAVYKIYVYFSYTILSFRLYSPLNTRYIFYTIHYVNVRINVLEMLSIYMDGVYLLGRNAIERFGRREKSCGTFPSQWIFHNAFAPKENLFPNISTTSDFFLVILWAINFPTGHRGTRSRVHRGKSSVAASLPPPSTNSKCVKILIVTRFARYTKSTTVKEYRLYRLHCKNCTLMFGIIRDMRSRVAFRESRKNYKYRSEERLSRCRAPMKRNRATCDWYWNDAYPIQRPT